MDQEKTKDRIEGDTIFIYDDSGDEFKVLKNIVFISKDGICKFRIQKSRIKTPKIRKYAMQK